MEGESQNLTHKDEQNELMKTNSIISEFFHQTWYRYHVFLWKIQYSGSLAVECKYLIITF